MATVEELQAQRDRLKEIRGKGIASYEIGDRSLRYRSDAEIAAAIADIDRQIAAASATPVRRVVVGTTKGF